jgi:hypothetical protein
MNQILLATPQRFVSRVLDPIKAKFIEESQG